MKTLTAAARLALGIDIVLLLVFVVIGRASHSEQLDLLGTLTTLWPFLVGLLAGWLIGRAWRTPFAIVWSGLNVWIATLVIGMLVRLVSGQGVEVGFVIVATLFLALFLLGWRALALLLRRRNGQTRASD